jgi:hypothetical protein
MRIHPPFKKVIVTLNNPEKFYNYMENSIESNGRNQSAQYVGKISKHGFLIEKKLFYFNTCRPKIRGAFVKEKEKSDKIVMNIESRKLPIIFILIFLSYILVAGIMKDSEYTFHILITCSILLYFLHWIMFSIDIKKTKVEFENIIRKASS